MLKIIRSSNLAPRKLGANEVIEGDSKADDRNLSKSKKFKNAKSGIQMRIGAMGESSFLTPNVRETLSN